MMPGQNGRSFPLVYRNFEVLDPEYNVITGGFCLHEESEFLLIKEGFYNSYDEACAKGSYQIYKSKRSAGVAGNLQVFYKSGGINEEFNTDGSGHLVVPNSSRLPACFRRREDPIKRFYDTRILEKRGGENVMVSLYLDLVSVKPTIMNQQGFDLRSCLLRFQS
jgi:hypothetical protein